MKKIKENWKDDCDGQECKCWASSETNCSCGVDWTPREVYELREALHEIITANDKYGNGARRWHPRITTAMSKGRKLLT